MHKAMPVLSVEGVVKSYSGTRALDGISFSVGAGEILGVLGPSGSGKSTLLALLGGLVMPDDGDIYVMGTSLYRDYESCMMDIGYVPEKPAFYDYMTCMENLRVFADMYGQIPRQRLDELLLQFDLGEYAYQKITRCPFSVQCRLAIAAAMLSSPSVLVLSNVFDGLDPLSIVDLRRTLRRLAVEQGLTIIVTSRLIGELERICDRVLILNEGRILGVGTVEGLKQASTGKYRHRLLLDRPEAAAAYLHEAEGLTTELRGDTLIIDAEQTLIPRIINMLYASGNLVYEISPIELTLEEAYYRLLRDIGRRAGNDPGPYYGGAGNE